VKHQAAIGVLTALGLALAACSEGRNAEVATNEEANVGTANAVALPGGGAAAPLETARIGIAQKEPYGRYLVDAAGRALYVQLGVPSGRQAADQASAARSGGQDAAIARCTDECAGEWPPVFTSGAPAAAAGVDAGKLGMVARPEGQQVTFGGAPLYYYVNDRSAGSTAGQDLSDRWGSWHLLSPDGQPIRGRQLGF
jgi:predicted lipoprotein with Yx(FWY)xxD motif